MDRRAPASSFTSLRPPAGFRNRHELSCARVSLIGRGRSADYLREHAGQVSLVAEAEHLSQLGPVGRLTRVCRRRGIENPKPWITHFGPIPTYSVNNRCRFRKLIPA
jgi:hypothetical protein